MITIRLRKNDHGTHGTSYSDKFKLNNIDRYDCNIRYVEHQIAKLNEAERMSYKK